MLVMINNPCTHRMFARGDEVFAGSNGISPDTVPHTWCEDVFSTSLFTGVSSAFMTISMKRRSSAL